MTPAEKTRLLAERVMGWEVSISSLGERGAWGGWIAVDVQRSANNFHPLTNLAHAGEVLEAMRAKGLLVRIYIEPDTNIVEVLSAEGDRMLFVACNPLPTAICHAALLANGVKEEEL